MKRILSLAAALMAAGGLMAADPPRNPSPPKGDGNKPDAPFILGQWSGENILVPFGESGERAPDKKAAAESSEDFVFFGDSRPVLIRLHIEVDGRPLEAAWNDFIDRLFKHLDADGNGVLSTEEFARTPTPQALFSSGPLFGLRGGGFPQAEMPVPEGGKQWTRERFAAYYRRIGGGPFQSDMGGGGGPYAFTAGGVAFIPGGGGRRGRGGPVASASADAINDAFFELLDANHDGKLSREELAAAPEILMKLDADEDETVSLNELLRQPAPAAAGYGVAFIQQPGRRPAPAPASNLPGLFLSSLNGGNWDELPRQLLNRYGKGAETLTRADLGLDQRTFDRLDADRDGKLDLAELNHYADRPADVELKVRLGATGPDQMMLEVMKDPQNPTPRAVSVSAADGVVRIEMDNAHLELRIGGGQGVGANRSAAQRQRILAEFKNADRDGNGYLDEMEAMQSPIFSSIFKAADRDGDGKLFEKEVIAYLDAMQDLQNAASAGCASASFSDDSRGLFDLVDTNHDGRLSLRELRQMVKLLDKLDKDGDGCISRSEIQKSYQVAFQQGPAGPVGGFNGQFVVVAGLGGRQAQPLPELTRGPLWFRKMDRNHDGDVSRKEFLGTDDEFKKLDLDGDGLISVEEAEQADRALRKGSR
ncbi:MAG TPA: EF-hand domain-containing protein [Gemmataceae bacterium]|nr:EF-hand domain-containing protein [Gemmataceae bacterium]